MGYCRPMSPIQWQHRSILVRRSTLMPPLRSEIYAWIDGRSWKRCPPRKKQPTHPGRVCNPPCLNMPQAGGYPLTRFQRRGRLTDSAGSAAVAGCHKKSPLPRPLRRAIGTKGSTLLFSRRPVESAAIRIPNWLGRVTLREVQGELHVEEP